MVQRYYETFVGSLPSLGDRNWTHYLKSLSNIGGDGAGDPDRRIVQILIQIKERYRTPMLQPEYTIDADEAMTLFNLGCGVIAMMSGQVRSRQSVAKNTLREEVREEISREPVRSDRDWSEELKFETRFEARTEPKLEVRQEAPRPESWADVRTESGLDRDILKRSTSSREEGSKEEETPEVYDFRRTQSA